MEIVARDSRVSAFLAENAYMVEGVRPLSGDSVIVTIQFEEPAPTDTWPRLDACEVGGADGPATGLDFQVDLSARSVVALSPRWGSVSCMDV